MAQVKVYFTIHEEQNIEIPDADYKILYSDEFERHGKIIDGIAQSLGVDFHCIDAIYAHNGEVVLYEN